MSKTATVMTRSELADHFTALTDRRVTIRDIGAWIGEVGVPVADIVEYPENPEFVPGEDPVKRRARLVDHEDQRYNSAPSRAQYDVSHFDTFLAGTDPLADTSERIRIKTNAKRKIEIENL